MVTEKGEVIEGKFFTGEISTGPVKAVVSHFLLM
jgi:hypothetical protein